MTLSELHEEILDDVRFCTGELFEMTDGQIRCFVEAALANIVMGTVGIGLVADAYFFVEDNGGPIAVEIGRMKDGKWETCFGPDGLPIRILRIGFDRSCWLLNPRNTEIEDLLFNFVRFRLTSLQADAARPEQTEMFESPAAQLKHDG